MVAWIGCLLGITAGIIAHPNYFSDLNHHQVKDMLADVPYFSKANQTAGLYYYFADHKLGRADFARVMRLLLDRCSP